MEPRFRIVSQGSPLNSYVQMKNKSGEWELVPLVQSLNLNIDIKDDGPIKPTIQFAAVEMQVEVEVLEEVYSKAPMGYGACVVNCQDLTPEMVTERTREIEERLKQHTVKVQVVPRVEPDKTNKGVVLSGIDGRLLSFEDIDFLLHKLMYFQYKDLGAWVKQEAERRTKKDPVVVLENSP